MRSKQHNGSLIAAVCVMVAVVGCGRRGQDAAPVEGTAEASGTGVAVATPEAGSGSGAQAAMPEAAGDPVPVVAPVNPQVQADRELAQRLGLAPPEPLAVAHLMTHADIRELVQYQGTLSLGLLEGVEPSATYNAIRLASEGGYGFALQVWRDQNPRQLEARYERMMRTYFVSSEDPVPMGDQAFRAEFEGIRHYAFMDRTSSTFAVITCQSDACLDQHIRGLAERVVSRL